MSEPASIFRKPFSSILAAAAFACPCAASAHAEPANAEAAARPLLNVRAGAADVSFAALTIGVDGSTRGANAAIFGGRVEANRAPLWAPTSPRCATPGACDAAVDAVEATHGASEPQKVYAMIAASLGVVAFVANRRRRDWAR